MKGKLSLKSLLIQLSALCVLLLFSRTSFSATIRVTWDPELVVAGGVVPLRIHSPIELMAADASVGEERFPLLSYGRGNWIALVGVDAGDATFPVDLTFFPEKGGPPYRIRADLMIRRDKGRKKVVQELSLPVGMVDLSEKRVREVRADNRTLGDSLATRTRERFWSGAFLVPVQGRISTRFGVGRVLNGKPRSSHSGVDIAADKGSAIAAANDGKVLLAEDFYLSGSTVVVDHGWGVCTIYAHMDRIDVKEGQSVQCGQQLGTVGTTGRATGPHLHFGAFIRGVKVDPLKLIEVTKRLE